MRILILTHSFNSLTQRLYTELAADGHELSVEFDVNDDVTIEAVSIYRPDLVLAPFLKRAIPEKIWRQHLCLVVHPGIPGDRGPSSLDWAILRGEREWGVTVLQATEVLDGGPVWAHDGFAMRAARKSSLYRNEVTESAVRAVRLALARLTGGSRRPGTPASADPQVRGRPQPRMTQADRAIDWRRDSTETVLRKIHAADSSPGVLDQLHGKPYYLFNAIEEETVCGSVPGRIIARRDGAILRATVDGAVWITHLKAADPEGPSFKLPAAMVLGAQLAGVPEAPLEWTVPSTRRTWKEIWYEEAGRVGYLHFDFYNGAMSTDQCRRLQQAFEFARTRATRVIVLMGGHDFWSNGIHLNQIEAMPSAADASWENILAMDDLCESVLTTESHLTVAAMQGNAGAGGVFLALAADRVVARRGVTLNPHYKGMGNLYGSEYWTYLLPRRVGADAAARIVQNRLPVGTCAARASGLIDDFFGDSVSDFCGQLRGRAEALAAEAGFAAFLDEKRKRRIRDENEKPLARYRAEELEHMRLNFYGFDPSYHVARYHFVHGSPRARTPLHLARHRQAALARAHGRPTPSRAAFA
jgi:putative two-component system hydrogenase maturation factor HypX/HoxX